MPDKEMNREEEKKEEFLPQQVIARWVECHTPVEIFAQLKEKVFGQDEAILQASVLVYSFLKNISKVGVDAKYHFMIEGNSGCGKSTFAKALEGVVPCPVIIADASQITASGYKGVDASDLLRSEELDEWWGAGILILDELDKLMEPMSSSSFDNFHRAGLETFLKILDGGTVLSRDGETSIRTDRLLVIGMGAFAPAKQEVKKTVRKIGFGELEPYVEEEAPSAELSRMEMSRFCGSEQFMGRFLTVVHFKPLGREVYSRIARDTLREIRLIHGRNSAPMTEEEINAIVEKALDSEFGCRGIRTAVWERFLRFQTVSTKEAVDRLDAESQETDRLLRELERIRVSA